jgi:hypothetical protein
VIACHPILIGVPPYNPRRIKRYVQSFQLARDYYPLAEDGSALRPSLLAKLTVIQYSYRDLYKEIIDNGRLLESLEATYRAAPDTSDGEGPDGDGGAGRHYRDNYPHLPTLLRLRIDDGDTFAGVDLQPYLSVFRDLTVSADAGDPAGGPSDDGNERTLVSEYLQRLRRRFRGVDLEVLTPVTEQEETPTIPLAEIFVEPWVREDVAPVELPRELVRQLVAAGGVDSSRELPAGISPDLLSRVYREQQRRPAQRLGSLLSGPAIRMVLLGDPGSGKSTAARWLALTLATGERSSAVPLSGWLPLLVQLREYATSGSETVLDYLEAAHAADDLGLPRPIVERWMLDDGRVLLILDGLDEIADPVARDMAARQITALAVRYPRIGIVVTARPVSHNRSIFHSAGFSHWVLQDFDR